MRREFGLVLLLGAAGAGLVVLAVRQAWAQAVFVPPRPLPTEEITVTGQQLVPLASALALAALACLAAVIATRSLARRLAGLLLAVLGAAAAAAAAAGVSASSVLATAQSGAAAGTLGGSTTSGGSPGGASHAIVIAGSAGHAVMTGTTWRAAALAGAAAVVIAGLATAWRGSRWPVMSARFERPGQQDQRPAPRNADAATIWESLSRDVDPTVDSVVGPGPREDQSGGGPPS
jgi:uncharacterized membrane protein (TIGR02234 family)